MAKGRQCYLPCRDTGARDDTFCSSKWCHQCVSQDISQLSCAGTSAPFLSVQHRTILACCAMYCIIATLFTISKEKVTLPSLITFCFLCQPDLKQVIFSCFFMICNSPFELCHWRLLVAIDRDCWRFNCRYQPPEMGTF